MNTAAPWWGHPEPPQATRFRGTITLTEEQIGRHLSGWEQFGGSLTIESRELIEATHTAQGAFGPVLVPARFRVTFVAAFPASYYAQDKAKQLCGVVVGLGGSIETT